MFFKRLVVRELAEFFFFFSRFALFQFSTRTSMCGLNQTYKIGFILEQGINTSLSMVTLDVIQPVVSSMLNFPPASEPIS